MVGHDAPSAILGPLALAVAASKPAVSYGPPLIGLFGTDIPTFPLAAAMVGLWMARGVSQAREKPQPGARYLTGVLIMVLFAVITERQPSTGVAVFWGLGVGASGSVLYDMLREWVIATFRRWTGGKQ